MSVITPDFSTPFTIIATPISVSLVLLSSTFPFTVTLDCLTSCTVTSLPLYAYNWETFTERKNTANNIHPRIEERTPCFTFFLFIDSY